jgi:hypothetical protein
VVVKILVGGLLLFSLARWLGKNKIARKRGWSKIRRRIKKEQKKKVVDIAGRSNYYNSPNYGSTKCPIYVSNRL